MSIKMIGKKISMTQIFNDKGNVIPVTFLQIGPCTITQIIKKELNNKYANIQIGYEYINPKKLNKAKLGHFKTKQLPCFRYLKEYKKENWHNLFIGQILNVKEFQIGNNINISGFNIGKGFSGYHKKHNFSRGPMSHGSKHHKRPGSIGAGTTPGRVFPGKRMAGRIGNKKVTIKNLKIVYIDLKKNLLVIKGSIPGKTGNILYINSN
uniref:Large ribosomal subunit protein uL3c n=1 Tax=Choreocolax polysiphoniae TaxID=282351 RepID=A0A0B5VUG8_9FLOR|nr:50S ribosomal protein L3 [Choreocolax polysiphoniae]AJH65823.1 50S ribosomal protein L3 [Choreocolax polysiphoniae]